MRTLCWVLAVAFCGALAGQVAFADEPVYRVGGGVTKPRVLNKVEAKYTEEARTAGVEGTVVLQVVIDQEGRPRNIRVVKGLRPDLDENAIAAAQQWEFEPGKKDGMPVAVLAEIEMNFRLLYSPREDPVFPVGGEVTTPQIVKRVEAEYTEEARSLRISGTVVLRAIVNLEGRAEDIVVVKSLRPDLDRNAIAALQKWEFEPGKKDGKPARVRATIEMQFRIGTP